MSNVTTSANASTVAAIGKGARLTETAVPAILALAGPHNDWTVRGAIPAAVHAWACGDAERPAVKVGRKGEQITTDYGRGVDTLSAAVKRALSGKVEGPALAPADEDAANEGSADETPADETPDYLALAVQAAATAVANGVDIADVLAAIAAAHVMVLAA